MRNQHLFQVLHPLQDIYLGGPSEEKQLFRDRKWWKPGPTQRFIDFNSTEPLTSFYKTVNVKQEFLYRM